MALTPLIAPEPPIEILTPLDMPDDQFSPPPIVGRV